MFTGWCIKVENELDVVLAKDLVKATDAVMKKEIVG
jgi:hypothetical protein